jgi:sugar/nucleoside kinase (ribokinase family)
LSTGGAVSNTGLGLRRLGARVALMGKIGDDYFGRVVRMIVEQEGVREGLLPDRASATSYTVVLAPAGFDRMFLHCPGANDTLCAADLDYDLIARATLFHFGYPPLMRGMFAHAGRDLVEIFRRVKARGVTTSLDLALPDPASPAGKADWRAILAAVLPYVDIFTPSTEELLYMLQRPRFDAMRARGESITDALTGDDLHALGDDALRMGAKIALIKNGHRGAYARSAAAAQLAALGTAMPRVTAAWCARELWHPVFSIDCVPQTTGSGDATIAGFLFALVQGMPLDRALQLAVANGTCSVTMPDALSGILPWAALCDKVAAGWPTAPLTVTGKGWRRDGVVWRGPADVMT